MSHDDDMLPKLSINDVTLHHKIDELKRELKMRRRLYPRWVEKGTLNPVDADIRIKILRAILNDYLNSRSKNNVF